MNERNKDSLGDKLRHPAIVLTQALRFDDETSVIKALDLITELTREGPFEFDRIPSLNRPNAILPEQSYRRLVPLLEQHGVKFREVTAVAVSGLPVEEQSRIRRRGRA